MQFPTLDAGTAFYLSHLTFCAIILGLIQVLNEPFSMNTMARVLRLSFVLLPGLLAVLPIRSEANITPPELPAELARSIAPLLSIKTPYFSTPRATPPSAPENCRLIHINHLGRHGSRHIANIKKFEREILARAVRLGLIKTQSKETKKSLLAADLSTPEKPHSPEAKWLSEQVMRLTLLYRANPQLPGRLTELGKAELEKLGQRLFTYTGLDREAAVKLVRSRKITAATTSLVRTQTSRDHFLKGMRQFLNIQPGALQLELITATSGEPDPQLQPYNICSKHLTKKSRLNQLGNLKAEEFLMRSPLKEGESISGIFLKEATNSQQQDLASLLYSLCQMDADDSYRLGLCSYISTRIGYSSMVSLFQNHNRAADIRIFYQTGPAKEFEGINRLMMINLLNAFLESTRKAIGDPEAPVLSLRFAHDSTLLRFLQILNIITEENSTQKGEVTWKLSGLAPMAGNLIWQTWSCGNSGEGNETPDVFRVRMLFNEESIRFPIDSCEPSDPFCDWSEVEAYYRKMSENISLEKACDGLSRPIDSEG
ncbi:MAG: histidine-type phosphatase [Endozoicomonas sp.]